MIKSRTNLPIYNVSDGEDKDSSLDSFVNLLETLLKKIEKHEIYEYSRSNISPLAYNNILTLIASYCPENAVGKNLRKALLSELLSIYNLSYGSQEIFTKFFIQFFKRYRQLSKNKRTQLKKEIEKAFESHVTGRRASVSDLSEIFRVHIKNKDLQHWILESLHLAGAAGNIRVTESKIGCANIHVSNDYNFRLAPPAQFKKQFNGFNVRSPLIFIIDGFIESVSEIHSLLTQLEERKECAIIFARNFHEDVSNTLAINFLRETLKVLPIVTPFNEHFSNALKDIAIVCNGDIRSSLKGELISTMTIEDGYRIKKLHYENGNVKIAIDDSYKDRILGHRQYLANAIESLTELERTQEKDMFLQRLASLSNRLVNVNVCNVSGVSAKALKEIFHHSLSTYKNIARNGVIKSEEAIEPLIREIEKKDIAMSHEIKKIQKFLLCKKIDDVSFYTSLKKANSLAFNYANAACFLTYET